MEKIKEFCIGLIVFTFFMTMITSSGWAWGAGKIPNLDEWLKQKNILDDPRPFLKGAGDPKNFLTPELYKKVTFDVEAMKKAWADVIGFMSPDLVGKIAPEIKPGTYTFQDKDKYPFKELMSAFHYNRFKPGGPPHVGNFSEIKVVPTRQYYWALPIAEATKKNEGKTKLDDKGYFVPESYVAGYPFPKPSGKFKAQQVVYNWYKRYNDGENNVVNERAMGFNRKLMNDWESYMNYWELKLNGRVLIEPFGWYDERARKRGEERAFNFVYNSPQDSAGNAYINMIFDDPDKSNQPLFYIAQMRRIRKLSAEDTQDPYPGGDLTMDDGYGFQQKLTYRRFPYKYELVGEREYLVPNYTWDGSMYFDSKKGYELHNEWERRPVYVLQLTQLDPNYIYSKRILYIDKESFTLLFTENYDQKGRLYRTHENFHAFHPEQGMFHWWAMLGMDHVDLHSHIMNIFGNSWADWVTRDHTGVGVMMKKGK